MNERKVSIDGRKVAYYDQVVKPNVNQRLEEIVDASLRKAFEDLGRELGYSYAYFLEQQMDQKETIHK